MKIKSIILYISLLFSSLARANSLNDSLRLLKKSSSKYGNIVTTKSLIRKGTSKNFITVHFEFQKALYQIEALFPQNEKDFQNGRNNLSSVIQRSFEDQPTPYAGEITNTAKCSSFFKPIFLEENVDSQKIYILKTLVPDDLSYGLCDKKRIFYSSCTAFYYDQPTSQAFKINIYVKPKLSCEKLTKELIQSFNNI